MSLLDAAERFASIDRSQIVLDPNRCLHSQDQYSECAACFHICPVHAIQQGKPPSFNPEQCESCLACLPACPVGAFHADDDVADLLQCTTHIESEPVELLCGLHPGAQTGTQSDAIGIQIHGCLAGLGVGAYLTLFALGLQRILVRTDACRTCKWQALASEIHRQAERADRFLSAWEAENTVLCIDQVESPVERALWSAKNPPLSRRDLFRLMARQGQVAMARAMEDGVAESGRQPGRDRMRTLTAISHLAEPSATVNLGNLGFATLLISEACTACGACARACPTEALRFEKNEKTMTFSFSFSPKSCIACDLCEHVCLPDAISLHHAPVFGEVFGVDEPVIVESGTLVRCARCRNFMAQREGRELCPLCEYRRTHPFGSMLPKNMPRGSSV